MEYLKRMNLTTAISGAAMLLAGILFCIRPYAATGVLSTIIGIAFMLSGILMLIHYFSDRSVSALFDRGGLVLGILLLAVGVFIVLHRGQTTEVFAYVFGIFIILDAISKMESAIMMCRLHVPGWVPLLLLSAALAIAAIYMLFDAEVAVLTMSYWIGISLIVDGISGLYMAARIKSAGSKLYQNAKDVMRELSGNIIDADHPRHGSDS